jgi:3-dehydroquinate synthetase
LNYGHTLGHAIEFTSGFKLRHGEAIAIGMVLEARLSEMLQLCHPGLSDRIAEVLSTIGLPTRLPTEYSFVEISQVMQKDKKRLKGEVRFALPVDIGEVRTNVNVEEKWIKQLF